jgi:diguanylate cyclase (GGDEF)-like protein
MKGMAVDADGGPTQDRRRLKPHQQIAVISIVTLVTVALTAAVMMFRIGQVDARFAQLSGHQAPITETLTKAELLYQADLAEANQLLTPMTEAQRAATISDLTEKTRVADGAWATYKRLANSGAGAAEKRLQVVAQNAEAEQIRLITPALSGKGLAPGTSGRYAQATAAQMDAIETLRGQYAARQATSLTALSTAIDRGRRDAIVALTSELAILVLAFGTVFASVRRRDRQVRSIEVARAAEAGRNDLETRLARSLEMVHTEESVYPRVQRALSEVAAGRSSELLLASSSHARLHQVIAVGAASEGGGCPVGTPGDCPAIARGQTQVFGNSGALDACPYLDGRPGGPCSAACIPLSIGGKSIGIVHVTAAPGTPPDPETVERLEIVARKAGDRIGMLRAFSRSETEAHTDQLTGLLNRRSLDDEVHRIVDSGQSYTVAYGDLDHFKQVNDVYGHDAGDATLRLFARVLRDSVRPNDVPARYGGEEFVVVLPECSIADASQVLERVRENLARAQATATSPSCTVSFGLARSDSARGFNEVLKVADHALAQAKEQGRDRIVAAPIPTGTP